MLIKFHLFCFLSFSGVRVTVIKCPFRDWHR